MYSLICRSEYMEQVRRVLELHGDIIFESTEKNLVEAGRVNAQILILDIESATVAEVKRFKIQRPETRIILLAPGRVPGDEIVAALVGKGVYDIVAPTVPEEDGEFDIGKELKKVLDGKAAVYADAARWDTTIGHNAEPETKEENSKIIFQEKLIGTGYIAVTGAGRASGSTTIAVAIAQYLARHGNKVALVEMSRYPVIYRIRHLLHKNVTAYVQTEEFSAGAKNEIKNLMPNVQPGNSYIVADIGACYYQNENQDFNQSTVNWHEYLFELNRAMLPLLVVGTAQWRWLDWLPLYINQKIKVNWNIITVSKEAVKDLRTCNKIHVVPPIFDPFVTNNEIDAFMANLLSPMMPTRVKKNGWLLWM